MSPKRGASATTTRSSDKVAHKSGLVAIIGRPNVGKSTLLNLLVETKLSAVSPKAQTTRHKILGIRTAPNYQIGFLDTPGVPYKAPDELNRRLVVHALEALQEADLALLMVEAKPPADIEARLIEELRKEKKAAILAINKVDLIKRHDVLPIMETYGALYPFKEVVPVSVLKQDGVALLLDLLVKHLPEGEPLFGPEEITDRSERFLVSELVREQIFNAYAQEVPYAVAVEIDAFVEHSPEHGGKDHIKASLFVEKDSQKGILIGHDGAALKRIGTAAREAIEAMTKRPTYLELWVRVFPKWQRDKAFLQRVGY